MTKSSSSEKESLQRLSSLVDGELGDGALGGICSAWKDDASTRRAWHTYQLIGDAMRSDDLATDPARDLAFFEAFRAKLAAEPVVLAPQVEPESFAAAYNPRRTSGLAGAARLVSGSDVPTYRASRRWRAPMSIAAGALAVTGVLMVARVSGFMPGAPQDEDRVAQQVDTRPQSQREGPVLVQAPGSAGEQSGLRSISVVTSSGPAATNELSVAQPQTLVANGKLIRDARLDQYLAAHKQFGGSSALGVPSGFLRSATSEGRDR